MAQGHAAFAQIRGWLVHVVVNGKKECCSVCQLTFREVSEILSLIERLDCDTLMLEYGDLRISLGRGNAHAPDTSSAARGDAPVNTQHEYADGIAGPTPIDNSSHQPASAAGPPMELPEHWVSVTAPMAGNFYRAPSPDAPPFVEVGDHIEAGQTVGLIEVMKLFSELKAEHAGKVVRIDGEEAALVEYDQPLVWIDPA